MFDLESVFVCAIMKKCGSEQFLSQKLPQKSHVYVLLLHNNVKTVHDALTKLYIHVVVIKMKTELGNVCGPIHEY